MNKTDRLLAIVLKLQSSGKLRAEDLAAIFETSKRTIYRDIQALSEAGVPIVATPGQGYGLVEGYFLPPLSFNSDEAVMLLIGGEFVAQNLDAQYRAAALAACLKIEGVLPPALREEVAQLQTRIRFVAEGGDQPATLKELRRAVIESKTVCFRYHARASSADPAQERATDPYGLVYRDGAWYLAAYCHLRQEVRNFRLDRIEGLVVTNQSFVRPADFRLSQTQENQGRHLTVRIRFNHQVARWVQESRYFYITDQQEDQAGLLVTLQVREEQDVVGWLLSWGQHVRVLEPVSLRQRLIQEARQVLQNYQEADELLT